MTEEKDKSEFCNHLDGCKDCQWTATVLNDRIEELQNRLSTLLKASEGMEKALELFTIAFDAKKDKLKQAWSFGYWDSGNIPEFYAVIQYNKEHIKKIMAALADFRAVKEGK